MTALPPVRVSGLPPFNWLNNASGDARSEKDGSILVMKTGPKTDWFNPPPDPSSPQGLSNAPALVFPAPPGDWQLSAKVSVDHKYLFDAATIFVHQNKNEWCKLCYEYSPEKKPTIVSVVTRDISDDCNGTAVDGGTVHLRVSKYGADANVFAFHYSTDGGKYWTLHRVFCVRQQTDEDSGEARAHVNTSMAGAKPALSIGFLAQCPTGDSCSAEFSDIKFSQTTLSDLRDGS